MPFFFVLADFTFFSFLFFFLGLFYQYAKDVCFNIPRFNFQIAYLFSILENYGCFPVHAIREGTGTTARQPYGSAVPAKVLKLFFNFSRFLLSKQPESSFFYFSTFKPDTSFLLRSLPL